MMENNYIVAWLEEKYPNVLPYKKTDDFELGVLVGQQMLIEELKIKLKVNEETEDVK